MSDDGEVRRRTDGFETWACYCGARGLGGAYPLAAHQETHPMLRMALAAALRRLSHWVQQLAMRAQTLHRDER